VVLTVFILAATSSFVLHIYEILCCRLSQTADLNTNSLITREQVVGARKLAFCAASDSWPIFSRPSLQPQHVADESWVLGFKPQAYIIPGNKRHCQCFDLLQGQTDDSLHMQVMSLLSDKSSYEAAAKVQLHLSCRFL